MTCRAATGVLALTAAAFLATVAPAPAAAAAFSYLIIDNPNDTNFNQLLGINNGNIIVGYDGDGTVVPNKGYMVVPLDHFSDENFPNSAQTQVVGINDLPVPGTVGFYIDSAGNNFGFFNKNGNFTSVADPNTGVSNGIMTNQLLGLNDVGQAVGFYNDASGNSHGYIYDVKSQSFTELSLPFPNVVSFQTTGINDAGTICGFYADNKGVMHGFLGTLGNLIAVNAPGNAPGGLTFLGLNNVGQAVGATIGGIGEAHGFVYEIGPAKFVTIAAPGSSKMAAFGVRGTTVNGINDNGALAGFFSDGTHVNGFIALPATISTADADN